VTPPPPPDDNDLLAECDVDTLRAGTSGGQRANKVETGIRLRHRPSGLIVVSRSSRSQLRNRVLALADLRRRLEAASRPEVPRRPTKPTRASRKRRLDAKRRRSETKTNRRGPDL
jgi:protein subunit release factor B